MASPPGNGPGARIPDDLPRGGPEAVRGLIEEFEAQLAQGMERLVAGEAFSELLVAMTENAVAVWRMSADAWDLVWRGLRLPGRADIDRLARQLARTEDKLELLLQAVEQLQDREAAAQRTRSGPAASDGAPLSEPPASKPSAWASPSWEGAPESAPSLEGAPSLDAPSLEGPRR